MDFDFLTGDRVRVDVSVVSYAVPGWIKKGSLPGLFPFLDNEPVIRDLRQGEVLTVLCQPIDFGWYTAMRVRGDDGVEGWVDVWPRLFFKETT